MQSKCTHHWIIEEARGETSGAKCKKCGITGEFYNYIDWYARLTIKPGGSLKKEMRYSFKKRSAESEANEEVLV